MQSVSLEGVALRVVIDQQRRFHFWSVRASGTEGVAIQVLKKI